jgi:uncharacterized protein YbcI
MTDQRDTQPESSRTVLLEISNTIVGLHKQYYGRGPTKARSTLSRDLLVVVLEGGFSQAEQTLAGSGRQSTVEDSRHAMQEVIKDRWIEAVERLLDRKVRSFVSGSDSLNQIQVETFVLEPEVGSSQLEDNQPDVTDELA